MSRSRANQAIQRQATERLHRLFRPPQDTRSRDPDDPAEVIVVRCEHRESTVDDTQPGLLARLAPAGLRAPRLLPTRRAAVAAALVALGVVLLVAGFAWHDRPRVTAIPAPRPAAVSDTGGSAARASRAATVVVVAVTGKVTHPGVFSLPAGARVADAVQAAGGLLPDADPGSVNLARRLNDGEQVAVGGAVPAGAPGPPGGPAGSATPGTLVNLNTATVEQLDTLPGVGPVLAQRIVDYRTRHGGFRSIDDLRQVDGVGDARFKQLKPRVTV
ncbi:MAG: helix-hairpin-helix domain-containing protein [Mycobacteriales bacterium]